MDKEFDKDFLKGLFEANAEAEKGAMKMAKDATPQVIELIWSLYYGFRKKGASKDEAMFLTKMVLTMSGGGK